MSISFGQRTIKLTRSHLRVYCNLLTFKTHIIMIQFFRDLWRNLFGEDTTNRDFIVEDVIDGV